MDLAFFKEAILVYKSVNNAESVLKSYESHFKNLQDISDIR